MIKRILGFGMAVLGLLAVSGAVLAAASFKEGQWTMTTTVEMPGMEEQMAELQEQMQNISPEQRAMMEQMMGNVKVQAGPSGGSGFSATITQCLTEQAPVPQSDTERGCRQTHNFQGDTMHFEVHCPNSRTKGIVVYRGESMSGKIDSEQLSTGQKTHIKISGQYIGPCE